MTGDSRPTTAPSAPGGAVAVFGDRLGLAERFVVHLATSAVERGLLGPREVPRLWERHVLNCAVVGELLEPGERCVDVGSGAGLPGLALAIARPDVRVTLVEPLQRRVTWLEEVVADLGLDGVEVIRARAEEVRGSVPGFDVATARAVAPLDRLAAWCLPLLRPGGRMLALKGRSAPEELRAADAALDRSGAAARRIVVCGVGVVDEPTTVVVIQAGEVPAASRPAGGARSAGGKRSTKGQGGGRRSSQTGSVRRARGGRRRPRGTGDPGRGGGPDDGQSGGSA